MSNGTQISGKTGALVIVGFIVLVFLYYGYVYEPGGQGLFESSFTIRVSGTNGLSFQGSYMIVRSDGGSNSRSVEGSIPAEFKATGEIVSCSFQKQSEKGNLKVEILKGGQVVSKDETSASYGVVTVATR